MVKCVSDINKWISIQPTYQAGTWHSSMILEFGDITKAKSGHEIIANRPKSCLNGGYCDHHIFIASMTSHKSELKAKIRYVLEKDSAQSANPISITSSLKRVYELVYTRPDNSQGTIYNRSGASIPRVHNPFLSVVATAFVRRVL